MFDVLGQNNAPSIPSGASPVITTTVSTINFQWGSGSVLGGPNEDVIVVFTGSILSDTTQDISFMASADDGTRLYIDGALITDDWYDKGGGGSTSSPVSFTEGTPKTIQLMYYENGGGASVTLYWNKSGDMSVVPASAFTSQGYTPVVPKTIGAPRNLAVIDGNTSTTLTWEAPNTGNTSPERYAISFSADGGGWGIATGNVGDANALNTTITISHSLLEGLKPSGTIWAFHIRSDNDTLSLYSANSNVVTLKIGKTQEEKDAETAAETARIAAEQAAALAAAQAAASAEAARIAAEQAALAEAERIAAVARQEELDRQAAIAAEIARQAELARQAAAAEAARIAALEAAAAEKERLAAAKAAAEAEAARLAAEAERLAAEKAAAEAEAARIKAEEEAKAAEEARLKAEAEAKAAAEAAAKAEEERIAAEEAAKKAEEERLAAEAEAKAKAEEEARLEAERIAAEEAAAKAEAEAKEKAEEEAKEKAEADAIKKAAEEGKLTSEQKEVVATALIASVAPGEVLSASAIQEAGIEYKDLPPETPVDVRTDENGNAVVITAEVAAQVELLENPSELLATALSDPGAALAALGSVGADMSDEERKEATEMVVATVIAAGAAMNAVAAAGGATGGSTGGSSGGGSGGGGGGGPSGESKATRQRKATK